MAEQLGLAFGEAGRNEWQAAGSEADLLDQAMLFRQGIATIDQTCDVLASFHQHAMARTPLAAGADWFQLFAAGRERVQLLEELSSWRVQLRAEAAA